MKRIAALLSGLLLVTGLLWPSGSRATDVKAQTNATAVDRMAVLPRSPVGFIKGYTWGFTGRRGSYAAPEAADSMRRMAAAGVQWVVLAFAAIMPSPSKPELPFGDRAAIMVTDAEVRHAVQLAREHGLKVCLKPMVNCQDGTWRAHIGFKTAAGRVDQTAWATWWRNYGEFLLHYATMAQATKCELLCLGCEMSSTEPFEQEWRALIAQVRRVYSGPLIYDTNHGREEHVAWWDAVDIIGISAYYPLGVKDDTSAEQLTVSWTAIRDRLRPLAAKWQRPICFIETGCQSVRLAARTPWGAAHTAPLDLDEQARYYASACQVFWTEPWFCGFGWWDWPPKLYSPEQAATDRGFCVYGKPAEQVLRQWYAKPHF